MKKLTIAVVIAAASLTVNAQSKEVKKDSTAAAAPSPLVASETFYLAGDANFFDALKVLLSKSEAPASRTIEVLDYIAYQIEMQKQARKSQPAGKK